MTNERGRTWKLIFGVLMMALCGWSAYALSAEPAPSALMTQNP